MMNLTLQYFKNIKFNPLLNKSLVNQGKKKYAITNIKNRTKNYQHMTIRKFGTKTRPLSFNTGPFNKPPEPPFDGRWIIAAAIICGGYFNLKK
jgi:hypothetical protein